MHIETASRNQKFPIYFHHCPIIDQQTRCLKNGGGVY
uniref:Uncharacterized protein n=1 Tax=Arundo donax TaxID=35708 RepID=A0A0A9H821_ARUDO